jgi:hypothetical protein
VDRASFSGKFRGHRVSILKTLSAPGEDGGLNPKKPRVSFIKHTREGVSLDLGRWILNPRSRLNSRCFEPVCYNGRPIHDLRLRWKQSHNFPWSPICPSTDTINRTNRYRPNLIAAVHYGTNGHQPPSSSDLDGGAVPWAWRRTRRWAVSPPRRAPTDQPRRATLMNRLSEDGKGFRTGACAVSSSGHGVDAVRGGPMVTARNWGAPSQHRAARGTLIGSTRQN